MSAAETWCLVAVVLAVASAVLYVIAPTAPDGYPARIAPALNGLAIGAVAIALWIALP